MSRELILRVDSTVYVYGTVTADHTLDGVPVLVALPRTGVTPSVSDFQSAEQVEVTMGTDTWTKTYRILVGPSGTIVPTVGTYDWTVKVDDTPEDPVFNAGRVRVTAT